jgi:MFS family permease
VAEDDRRHPPPDGTAAGAPPRAGRIYRSGIFYGWFVAGAAFLASLGSVVFFNPVLGVFATSLREEFGWGSAQIALAIGIGGATAALLSPAIGWAIDRWGGRWVIGLGAVAMGGCLLALAAMQSLWQLYVFYSLGRALSVGVVSAAAFVTVSNWFVRRRALVVSLVAIGSRLGMAILPLLAAVVISISGTWRAGWIALAAVVLTVGVAPALLLIRRRPEDVGLRPDGDPEPVPDRPLPEEREDHDFTLGEAARTRAYWLLAFGVACILFSAGSINFHLVPHLEHQGMPRAQAAFVVTVFSIFGIVGSLVGGVVATRLTIRWTMAISLAGQAGGVLLLITVASLPSAMVYATTYGLVFGSMVALNQALYADYFGRTALGLIRGSVQPLQMGANAAGPVLTGVWFDRNSSYDAPFTLFAVLARAGAPGG